MARYDFRTARLFLDVDLSEGDKLRCTSEQAHYLLNVLRGAVGGPVLVFNGRDGEWRSRIAEAGRGHCSLLIEERLRVQEDGPDLHYWFAPLKRARLDYMVQKAVELGVSRLQPVLTQHTDARRVNLERMRANSIEAAEQCGILRIPDIAQPMPLAAALRSLADARWLIACDESAPLDSPLEALDRVPAGPVALLVGPEGGFADAERDMLGELEHVSFLSLGPRSLRADTASVAALALVNAVLGDWRSGPNDPTSWEPN